MIMRRTSVVVQGRNDGSIDDARLVISAGGTPAVDARMSSIFRAKNLANSSAEWPVTPAVSRSPPSKVDNERHSWNDDPWLDCTRSSQCCYLLTYLTHRIHVKFWCSAAPYRCTAMHSVLEQFIALWKCFIRKCWYFVSLMETGLNTVEIQ